MKKLANGRNVETVEREREREVFFKQKNIAGISLVALVITIIIIIILARRNNKFFNWR